jgi:hypothetical protein
MGAMPVSWLSMCRAIVSKSKVSPSANSLTGRGVSYLALKLNVSGIRKMRAASAVTVMSMLSFCCLHRRLKFSATGFQDSMSTVSSNGQ